MTTRAIQSSKTSTLSKCFEPLVDLALVDLALVGLALVDWVLVDWAVVDLPLLGSPSLALVQIHLIESFLNVSPPADRPLSELPFLGSWLVDLLLLVETRRVA
jgi:hypothetical protein